MLEQFSWLKSWGDLQSLCFSEPSESSGWKKMMIDDTLIHFESAQKGSTFKVYSELKSCQDARVPCKQQRFTHNRPFLHVMFSNSTWFWLPNNGMCTPKKHQSCGKLKSVSKRPQPGKPWSHLWPCTWPVLLEVLRVQVDRKWASQNPHERTRSNFEKGKWWKMPRGMVLGTLDFSSPILICHIHLV